MTHAQTKHIVCLGGGIGTVNLVKGLRDHTEHISVIVSVADDGGSAGRLRRLYNIPAPGDIVSCIAALSKSKNAYYPKLLTYRFPGDRYGKDHVLSGHKLGNLMMAAAIELTGNVQQAIELMKEMFHVTHNIFAATSESIMLSAVTVDGITVDREENIDLGKYEGKRVIEKIYITPSDPTPSPGVIEAINSADILIAGPGDLYTTILPVLVIPAIKEALLKSTAKKVFVVNVANKPFETKDYTVSQFIEAIQTHLGTFPFQTVLVNDNYSNPIPQKFHYTYVKKEIENTSTSPRIITTDLVDASFPLYHDSQKLASTIINNI